MRSAPAIGPAPAPALLLLKATIRVATVNRLIASGLQNRPFCIAISAVLQVETGRIAMPNGPFQVRHAMLLTMPKFTSHFSHSFTAIVYILEHPLLNDFTALEKCP